MMRWIWAFLLIAGCVPFPIKVGASEPLDPAELAKPGWIVLANTPELRQQSGYDCGAAALSMVLGRWKIEAGLEEICAACQEAKDKPIVAARLRDFARSKGMQSFVVPGTFEDVKTELSKGRPFIVGVRKRIGDQSFPHFEVVIAFRPADGRIVTLDPARGARVNGIHDFLAEWQESGRCTIVVLPPEKK